jgi:hypothetical protein
MTVAEDPKNPAVLYAGTEFGLYLSTDRGGSWNRVRSGLPSVPIHEIVFHPRENDMILATHGRSIWILDDATPIQQSAEAFRSDAFLFDFGRPAMQYNPANDRGFVTDKPFRGRNPTFGVPISYYLKGAVPQANVSLRIRDASGTLVRTLTGNDLRDATKAGVNRVHWDFRYQPLADQGGGGGGRGGGGGGFGGGGGNNGPFVLPGEYRVTLVVSGKDIATKSVRVAGDTAIRWTDADRKQWHDTALALHRLQEQANEAADAVEQLGTQYQSLETLMKVATNASSEAKSAFDAAGKQLASLRQRLGVAAPGAGGGGRGGRGGGGGGGGFGGQQQNVRGSIGQVKGQLMGAHTVPTGQQMRALTQGREDLTSAITDINTLISTLPGVFDKIGATAFKPPALKTVRPLNTTQ